MAAYLAADLLKSANALSDADLLSRLSAIVRPTFAFALFVLLLRGQSWTRFLLVVLALANGLPLFAVGALTLVASPLYGAVVIGWSAAYLWLAGVLVFSDALVPPAQPSAQRNSGAA